MANRPTPILIRPLAPGEELRDDNIIPLYLSNAQEQVDELVANGATIVKRESNEDTFFYIVRDPFGIHWKIATQNLAPPPPPPPPAAATPPPPPRS